LQAQDNSNIYRIIYYFTLNPSHPIPYFSQVLTPFAHIQTLGRQQQATALRQMQAKSCSLSTLYLVIRPGVGPEAKRTPK
jgi:hypothetical protein